MTSLEFEGDLGHGGVRRHFYWICPSGHPNAVSKKKYIELGFVPQEIEDNSESQEAL